MESDMNGSTAMPHLKAVIFDFDGTIIDTESTAFRAWQHIYSEHGQELKIEEYAQCIGTNHDVFNPQVTLSSRVAYELDWEEMTPRRRMLEREFLSRQKVAPGVRELIETVQSHGLRLAIGSSSPRMWIDRVMPLPDADRIFDAIITSDDAPPKPKPDIFLLALDRLGIGPSEAVVIEDSPNGALAAYRAGIFCITIPNDLTRLLRFEHGDLKVESLAEVTFEQIRDAHQRHQLER
ncbi:MAG: HAD family phosphatase [Opitutaceae bacterium]